MTTTYVVVNLPLLRLFDAQLFKGIEMEHPSIRCSVYTDRVFFGDTALVRRTAKSRSLIGFFDMI